MFLILGALRNFNTGMNALRQSKWRGHPAPPLGHDPQGKVLGILGMGGIGRNLKKKAEAFGMKVIYHNRRKLSEEMSAGAQYVSFDKLLSTSDVVSLNLPLNVSDIPTDAYDICPDRSEEKHAPYHQQSRVC
jgi:lactate dehydrogenase-like 2-hydroxyacid dehydrogenase